MTPRTAVTLNIYDLVEANEYIAPLGLGIFHSGVEIAGEEFSYASGAGIFSSRPRQAPGARFRGSIAMGIFEGSFQEAHQLAYSLSSDFEGEAYNLFTKNCNTYADALCQVLLNKSIPAYVNRAAYFGSFLSCLMPADLMDQAPVGVPNTPSRIMNAASRRSDSVYTPFAGSGQIVGGIEEASSPEPSTQADRRKKVRMAALRRVGADSYQKFSRCFRSVTGLHLTQNTHGCNTAMHKEVLESSIANVRLPSGGHQRFVKMNTMVQELVRSTLTMSISTAREEIKKFDVLDDLSTVNESCRDKVSREAR
ncbi:unnamed protein product [Peronospora belbahrii]|uniref:PPPDE domain-containing protein n=1 Tax=Peronospora belbahrii TaxID=622444 RepID=A0AAU9L1V8_9STRA|nr:unnamed protein product [Peronospora belbahrii]